MWNEITNRLDLQVTLCTTWVTKKTNCLYTPPHRIAIQYLPLHDCENTIMKISGTKEITDV